MNPNEHECVIGYSEVQNIGIEVYGQSHELPDMGNIVLPFKIS